MVCNLYVYFYFIIIIRNKFEFDDLKYCVLISVLRFTIGNVISTLKLNGWPTNLVFSQLKEYPISLNCYKDIYP